MDPGLSDGRVPLEAAQCIDVGRNPAYTPEEELALADFIRAWNNLSQIVLADNIVKGFWPKKMDTRNVGECLMLVVTELSEAMEGHRKDRHDDHLPHRIQVEVEIADAIIRLLDLAAGFQWDVGGALREKLLYNRSRPFKHGKRY